MADRGIAAGESGVRGGAAAPARQANKWAILFTVLVMTFMVCVDGSIVNVALPVMASEMGESMGDVEWVATSYMLLSCAAILVCGRLGDILGKVRVFQAGVALFSVGSLLCGVSPNLQVLVVSRALQGLGGAAAFSNNQGIITETFPSNERGHALGWLASFAAVGSMLGPTLGGLMLSVLPWNAIFLVNVPVGVASLLVGLRTLPDDPPARPGRLDRPGSVLLFSSLVLVVGATTAMQQQVSLLTAALLAVGVGLLAAFVAVERRVADPVFPLVVLRNKILVLNMFTMFAIFFVIGGQNMLLPFYLQDARGLSAMGAGLFMTVIPIVTGVFGPVAGATSDRIGCYWPTCLGLFLVGAGELSMAAFGLETPWPLVVCGLVTYGLGSASFMSPNNSLVMGSASPDELGVIGGLAAFARTFGQVAGLTASTSALYAVMSAEVGHAVSDFIDDQPQVYISAMSAVFVLMAVVVFLGFAGTVVRFVEVRRQEHEANVR